MNKKPNIFANLFFTFIAAISLFATFIFWLLGAGVGNQLHIGLGMGFALINLGSWALMGHWLKKREYIFALGTAMAPAPLSVALLFVINSLYSLFGRTL